MRNILIILFFLLCRDVSNAQRQITLETATEKMGVSINMPSCFNVSANKDITYVTENTKKDPIPHVAQSYRFEPAYGNTAFKVLFGMVNAIIEHKSAEYLIFVYVSPGINSGKSSKLAYERIKHDFRYGKPMNAPTGNEEYELSLKLTHYPQEQARKIFNADIMAGYPFDLEGNIYRDKYTKCKAVVAVKGRGQIFFYFMMTDEGVKKFDTYLMDLEKVFWFND